jgi:hypothetical protein
MSHFAQNKWPHLISVITVLWAKNNVFAYIKLLKLKLKQIIPSKADKTPFSEIKFGPTALELNGTQTISKQSEQDPEMEKVQCMVSGVTV